MYINFPTTTVPALPVQPRCQHCGYCPYCGHAPNPFTPHWAPNNGTGAPTATDWTPIWKWS